MNEVDELLLALPDLEPDEVKDHLRRLVKEYRAADVGPESAVSMDGRQ
jgi:hypothetical protein